MNDEELMDKTLREILQGGDDGALRALMLVSNDVKRRTQVKLADPEARKRMNENLERMFRSPGPKP